MLLYGYRHSPIHIIPPSRLGFSHLCCALARCQLVLMSTWPIRNNALAQLACGESLAGHSVASTACWRTMGGGSIAPRPTESPSPSSTPQHPVKESTVTTRTIIYLTHALGLESYSRNVENIFHSIVATSQTNETLTQNKCPLGIDPRRRGNLFGGWETVGLFESISSAVKIHLRSISSALMHHYFIWR